MVGIKKGQLLILLIITLILINCDNPKTLKVKDKSRISSDTLLSLFFKNKLDSLLVEPKKKIIVFAEFDGINSSIHLKSNFNNYFLFADTLSFNRILQDTSSLKFLIPIYVKHNIENDTINFMLFKHNKEIIYNVRFNKKKDGSLEYFDNITSYVKFRYKQPFNNQ